MSPAEIIEQCTDNGLTLTVTNDGNLDVIGSQDWIDIWAPILRENKSAILEELTGNAACNVSVTPEVTQQPFNECSTDVQQKENNGFSSIVSNSSAKNNELETSPLQAPYKSLASPFETQGNSKYSVTCTDASTDPVLAEVTIAGQASFTLEIPKLFYDGLALLEILEQHNETHSVMSGLSKETEGIDSRRAA